MSNLANFYKSFNNDLEKTIRKTLKPISFEERDQVKQPAIPNNFQQFNEMIGFPTSSILNEPQPLTPYQIQYHEAIQKFNWVIVNKSRKIGATEAAIRSIAFNVFDKYKGHNVLILAGNELRIAKEILKRFYELFKNKSKTGYSFKEPGKDGNKWYEQELMYRPKFGNTPEIEFKNGTRVMAFTAIKSVLSQSSRGTDDVACIFLSEASHVGMNEDQAIMNALEPNLANRDNGHFILESTPRGKRGFFYNYWKNAMKNLEEIYGTNNQMNLLKMLWKDDKTGYKLDWYPLMWDYTEGLKHNVISRKFIERERKNKEIDFEQEYCCSFTSKYTQAIDVSNLQYLPEVKSSKSPDDLLEFVGKKSASSTL